MTCYIWLFLFLLVHLNLGHIDLPKENEESEYSWISNQRNHHWKDIAIYTEDQLHSNPENNVDPIYDFHIKGLENSYLDKETQMYQNLIIGANIWDDHSVFIGASGRHDDPTILSLSK